MTADGTVPSSEQVVAAEVTDLLREWRNTCRLMGMKWTDRDAGAFVAAALAHRVDATLPVPPDVVIAVRELRHDYSESQGEDHTVDAYSLGALLSWAEQRIRPGASEEADRG